MTRQIFVFGSNLAGMHGGGSAAVAHKEHGAVWGEGIGSHGNSYAIPTLDAVLNKLELQEIAAHVADFIEYAKLNPSWTFNVVAIGCGIARFMPSEIGPMFSDAPQNCVLPAEFAPYIQAQNAVKNEKKKIWSHNAETCEDVLKLWQEGESVWSVEMGGVVPGYEQAIQILAFEILKKFVESKPVITDSTAKGVKEILIDPLVKRLSKVYGYSGAQVGAAINIASVFYKHGYRKGLDMVDKERHILVSRKFPTYPETEAS